MPDYRSNRLSGSGHNRTWRLSLCTHWPGQQKSDAVSRLHSGQQPRVEQPVRRATHSASADCLAAASVGLRAPDTISQAPLAAPAVGVADPPAIGTRGGNAFVAKSAARRLRPGATIRRPKRVAARRPSNSSARGAIPGTHAPCVRGCPAVDVLLDLARHPQVPQCEAEHMLCTNSWFPHFVARA